MSIMPDQTLLANPHAIVIPVLPLAVEHGPGPAMLLAATCTLCWGVYSTCTFTNVYSM